MEIGQLVKVKSTGLVNIPIMQIRQIKEIPESLKVEDDKLQDEITCFWFDANSGYREQIFNENEIGIFEPVAIAFY